ncbi:MAG: C-terminal binding protein [Planctomycetia bacterium]
MTPRHLLVADWFARDFTLEEEALGPIGATWSLPDPTASALSREQQVERLLDRIRRAERIDAVLFVLAPLTTAVIDALPPECRLLQRVGIGLDTVDLDAARRRGITVDNTPDYATEEVAVHALAMILSLHRQLDATQRRLLAGTWSSQSPLPIERLSTQTLGLVGLGRIGRKLADLCRPLFGRVLVADPAARDVPDWIERVDLRRLLQESDVVSLHCPLLPETRHLIDESAIALMKPTATLINVARGGVVDADALATALRDRRIAAAALDVYEPEVLAADSPLRPLDNVILTSHTAWYSRQSTRDCRLQAIEKVVRAFQQGA